MSETINKCVNVLLREVAHTGAPFAKVILRDAQERPIATVIVCIGAGETEEILEAVEDVEAGWELAQDE